MPASHARSPPDASTPLVPTSRTRHVGHLRRPARTATPTAGPTDGSLDRVTSRPRRAVRRLPVRALRRREHAPTARPSTSRSAGATRCGTGRRSTAAGRCSGRPSASGGLRDPFLVRSPEGDRFYLLATDLRVHGDGTFRRAQERGSRSLMVWESTDLVHWGEQRMVEVSPRGRRQHLGARGGVGRGPRQYVVYWASNLYPGIAAGRAPRRGQLQPDDGRDDARTSSPSAAAGLDRRPARAGLRDDRLDRRRARRRLAPVHQGRAARTSCRCSRSARPTCCARRRAASARRGSSSPSASATASFARRGADRRPVPRPASAGTCSRTGRRTAAAPATWCSRRRTSTPGTGRPCPTRGCRRACGTAPSCRSRAGARRPAGGVRHGRLTGPDFPAG